MSITLREARQEDLPLMLAWRSNPVLYRWFKEQSGPLRWEDHLDWWTNHRANRMDWLIMLTTDSISRPVGSVVATRLDTGWPEIGVWIGEELLWGGGIAKMALLLLEEWLVGQGHDMAVAKIMQGNERSLRLFAACGFEPASTGRGWVTLTKKLAPLT